MNNRDVEQLFEMVSIGDAVELVAERTPETDEIFGPALVTFVGPRPPVAVTQMSHTLAQTSAPASQSNNQ
jgi:hypothetical protein